MSQQDEIKKAIGAHGMWKSRLRQAVDSGKSEWVVETVERDNQCEFGKWIHAVPASGPDAVHAARVKDLHARFHVEAARVLGLAKAGQKEAAARSIAAGSTFDKLTTDLTRELMEWSKAA